MTPKRNSARSSPPSSVPPTSAIDFVNKVKQRYEDKPTVYQEFLEILKKIQALQSGSKHVPFVERRNAENEIYFEIVTLFQESDDLVEEFRSYMMSGNGPDGGDQFGARRPTRSRSSAPSPSTNVPPSKRRAKAITSGEVSQTPSTSTGSTQPKAPSFSKSRESIKPLISGKVTPSPEVTPLTSSTNTAKPSTSTDSHTSASLKVHTNLTTKSDVISHTTFSSFSTPSTSHQIPPITKPRELIIITTSPNITPTTKSSALTSSTMFKVPSTPKRPLSTTKSTSGEQSLRSTKSSTPNQSSSTTKSGASAKPSTSDVKSQTRARSSSPSQLIRTQFPSSPINHETKKPPSSQINTHATKSLHLPATKHFDSTKFSSGGGTTQNPLDLILPMMSRDILPSSKSSSSTKSPTLSTSKSMNDSVNPLLKTLPTLESTQQLSLSTNSNRSESPSNQVRQETVKSNTSEASQPCTKPLTLTHFQIPTILRRGESDKPSTSRVLFHATKSQFPPKPKHFEASKSSFSGGTSKYSFDNLLQMTSRDISPSSKLSSFTSQSQTLLTPMKMYGSVKPPPNTYPKLASTQRLSLSTSNSDSSFRYKHREPNKSETNNRFVTSSNSNNHQTNPRHPFLPSKSMYDCSNPLSTSDRKVTPTPQSSRSANSNKSTKSSSIPKGQEWIEPASSSKTSSTSKLFTSPSTTIFSRTATFDWTKRETICDDDKLSRSTSSSNSSLNTKNVESVTTSPIKSDQKRKRESSSSQPTKRTSRSSDAKSTASKRSTDRKKSSSRKPLTSTGTATSTIVDLSNVDMNVSSNSKPSTQNVEQVPAQSPFSQVNLFGPSFEKMSNDSSLQLLSNASEVHPNLANSSMSSLDPNGESTFTVVGNPQTVPPLVDLSNVDMNISSNDNSSNQKVEHVRAQPISSQANIFDPNFDEMSCVASLLLLSNVAAEVHPNPMNDFDRSLNSRTSSTLNVAQGSGQSLTTKPNIVYLNCEGKLDSQLPSRIIPNLTSEFDHFPSDSSQTSTCDSESTKTASSEPDANSIANDHSELERVGQSYVKLHNVDKCSGRDLLCNQVLNDTLAIRGGPFKINDVKNESVEDMFRVEDERAQWDNVFETTESTMKHLRWLVGKMERLYQEDPLDLWYFKLDKGLNGPARAIYRISIARIYGDDKFEAIYHALRRYPIDVVPLVHRRLHRKLREWRRAQEVKCFTRWQNETAYAHSKSLDVRGLTFREEDSKRLERTALLREIQDMKTQTHRGQTNGQQTQLLKEFPEKSTMNFANVLIMYHVQKVASIQMKQKKMIKELLTKSMPELLLHVKYQVEGCKTFYANDHWYYFLRLYILLCERLLHMRNVELEREQSENDELRQNERAPPGDDFTSLVELVKMTLDKKLTVELYKDEVRDRFGNKAYTAYTLDLIVQKIGVEIIQLVSDQTSIECKSLFSQSLKTISTAARHSVEDMKKKVAEYCTSAKRAIYSNHITKIVFDKANGHVSFEFERNQVNIFRAFL